MVPSDPPARRALAILGSALFLAISAGIGAGLVPWWISHWDVQAPLFGFPPVRALGVLLIVLGIPVLLDSFARFALQGIGTPAPVFPTRHLVVTGFYRYVRNPIYLAVLSVILGQGMILGNVNLLAYGVLAWLSTHLFVVAYEEPTLRKTFGAEYDAFCANVPRWVPRLSPWNESTGRTTNPVPPPPQG
jgi:protein-S-isoprenylcysteine O-methyltransferase Ste14